MHVDEVDWGPQLIPLKEGVARLGLEKRQVRMLMDIGLLRWTTRGPKESDILLWRAGLLEFKEFRENYINARHVRVRYPD